MADIDGRCQNQRLCSLRSNNGCRCNRIIMVQGDSGQLSTLDQEIIPGNNRFPGLHGLGNRPAGFSHGVDVGKVRFMGIFHLLCIKGDYTFPGGLLDILGDIRLCPDPAPEGFAGITDRTDPVRGQIIPAYRFFFFVVFGIADRAYIECHNCFLLIVYWAMPPSRSGIARSK